MKLDKDASCLSMTRMPFRFVINLNSKDLLISYRKGKKSTKYYDE